MHGTNFTLLPHAVVTSSVEQQSEHVIVPPIESCILNFTLNTQDTLSDTSEIKRLLGEIDPKIIQDGISLEKWQADILKNRSNRRTNIIYYSSVSVIVAILFIVAVAIVVYQRWYRKRVSKGAEEHPQDIEMTVPEDIRVIY